MICIKSKTGLSIEKCALAQTNPVGKLRKFLMFCCVFITALSRKSHIKHLGIFLDVRLRTFDSNYYRSK